MRPARCLLFSTVVALTASLGAAHPAQAGPRLDEATQMAEAERACLDGNTQRGIELLTALYLVTRHPAYLHNQARCYEQNGQYRAAAGRYREFLRKVKEVPPEKLTAETTLTERKVADIEAHARELERMTDEARTGEGAAAAPAKTSAPEVGPAPRESPSLVAGASPAPAKPSAGLRTAGIVALAAGALALGGGGVSAFIAKQKSDSIEQSARQKSASYNPEQYQAGQRATTLANIGFIAGPVLLGTGVLLYWLGSPSSSSPSSAKASGAGVMVLPTVSRACVGGLLSVSY